MLRLSNVLYQLAIMSGVHRVNRVEALAPLFKSFTGAHANHILFFLFQSLYELWAEPFFIQENDPGPALNG
jgi:hypothetical protein